MYQIQLTAKEIDTLAQVTNWGYFPKVTYDKMTLKDEIEEQKYDEVKKLSSKYQNMPHAKFLSSVSLTHIPYSLALAGISWIN